MYAALDYQGRLVYASEATGCPRPQAWTCPTCHQAVKLRTGRRIKPHFVHVSGACGQVPSDGRLVTESAQHQAAKRLLGQTFQQQGQAVNLEYYLPSTGQFADVYLPEQEWVLEYQQSVISAELLAARQADYQAQGQTVTWLLASVELSRKLKSRWKQTCLHYAPAWGYYWLALDVSGARLIHHYQLPLVYSRLAYRYQERTLDLAQLSREPWQRDLLAYARWHDCGARACQECRAARTGCAPAPIYPPAGSATFWRILYQDGIQIGDLPTWCLAGHYQALLSPQPGWVWLAYQTAYLRQLQQTGQALDRADWCAYHERLIATGKVSLLAPPLLVTDRPNQLLTDTCQAWLQLWRAQGVICPDLGSDGYRVTGVLTEERSAGRGLA